MKGKGGHVISLVNMPSQKIFSPSRNKKTPSRFPRNFINFSEFLKKSREKFSKNWIMKHFSFVLSVF